MNVKNRYLQGYPKKSLILAILSVRPRMKPDLRRLYKLESSELELSQRFVGLTFRLTWTSDPARLENSMEFAGPTRPFFKETVDCTGNCFQSAVWRAIRLSAMTLKDPFGSKNSAMALQIAS